MVTVKACQECNREKSAYDDYLRDYLVLDFQGHENANAQDLFNDSVGRAIQNNHSVLVREIRATAQIRPYVTLDGFSLGDFPMAAIDDTRIDRELEYIVRGLYYSRTRTIIPTNYIFSSGRIDPFRLRQAILSLQHMHVQGPFQIGDGSVFAYCYVRATEDPSTSLWLLWFHGAALFWVASSASSV
jgi:hypothetical protein